MKIAVFHELPLGGARRAVNEISFCLKKNHCVDLYLVDSIENQEESKNFSNIFFYKFVPKEWHGHDWKIRLYKDTIELIKLYLLHRKISSDIRKKKYDVLFVHSSKFTEAPFLLRFSNLNKIFYCHDPHYRILYEDIFSISKELDVFRYIYEKLNRYVRKIIDKSNFCSADLILANSLFTKKESEKTYGIKSDLCYLGVNHDVFKPEQGKKKNIDVLYIGSYEPVDGYSTLEESIKYINKKVRIKTVMMENEWISADYEMADLYRRSKIVVCLAYNEPFGLIPLEAMSCATPVIAVNEGGYKETVKNEYSGYLIPRNPRILASKIEYLLKNPIVAQKFGKNGRKSVLENWTWDKCAKKFMIIANYFYNEG